MAPSGKRVLFAILPVLVLVGAVELAATVHRIVSCPGAPPTFAVPNVQYGWLHPADTTVRAWGCAGSTYEWANEVRFNSHGLVGPDVPHERRPGVPRVLVLGDSVAEAMQVPPGADFSSRLRQRFAESGRRVEIVNAGHSGFGTDNELLFYEAEGRRYRPDIVLLELNLQNDFAENSPAIVRRMYLHGPDHPKADLTLLDEEQIDVDPAPFAAAAQRWREDPWRSSSVLAWLRRHSFFVRRLHNLLHRPDDAPAPMDPAWSPPELGVYATPPDDEWKTAARLTGALVRHLDEEVSADGAALLVAIVPSRETVTPELWPNLVRWFPALADQEHDMERPRRVARDLLDRSGVPFVDTTEVLRAMQQKTGEPAYLAFDPHPSAAGHRWIADAIFPALRELVTSALVAAAPTAENTPAER